MAPPQASSVLTRDQTLADATNAPGLPAHTRKTTSRPSAYEMTLAVVTDTGCDKAAAEAFVAFMTRARNEADDHGYYRLGYQEMNTFHGLLNAVMPDEAKASPDSAHAIIEQGLGVQYTHTVTEDKCAVLVHFG